jgi:tetratricopeptide (TPR) repeat protein
VLTSLALMGYIAFYQGDYDSAESIAEQTYSMSAELEALRAKGYAQILIALGKYSEENLNDAMDILQESLVTFKQIADLRSITLTYVNLARTAYRQGNHPAAVQFLEDSLSTSKELNTRWNQSFVLEIMALLERSEGNYGRAFGLFQESLSLAVEQDNQQGIANCIGGLAGLAVLANQPVHAVHLFAAAAKLRRAMGAKMSTNDRVEYEKYLTMVHVQLDHATFEAEWSEGFMMTLEKIIEELSKWSDSFDITHLQSTSNPLLSYLNSSQSPLFL